MLRLNTAGGVGMFARRLILTAALALVGGMNAQAGPFSFDFDGAGGGAPVGGVTGFDWKPGNLVAVDSETAIAAGTGATFTSYYQAALSSLLGPGTAPTGQVTIVATVQEQVVAAGPLGPGAAASFDVTGGTFRIYANSTQTFNDLTGAGFTDGVLIMSGTFTGGRNTFTITDLADRQQFDQFPDATAGNNNFPGIGAVDGTGGVNARGTVDFYDPNYFIIGNQQFVSFAFGGNVLSYYPPGTSNPSQQFPFAGNYVPNIGPTNGAIGGGTDVQFSTDTNQGFVLQEIPGEVIPEPTSIAALSLVLGVGALRLTRRGRGKNA
jgi:hypothetical protein